MDTLLRIIRNVVVASLLAAMPIASLATINDANFGSVEVSSVTSIYDGDTFRVNVDGWPPVVGQRIPVRLRGADTPEMRGRCDEEKRLARLAKQFTVQALRGAQQIELRNIRRGKYFRLIADVYVDGNNLADALVAADLARPYEGGKRKSWCH